MSVDFIPFSWVAWWPRCSVRTVRESLLSITSCVTLDKIVKLSKPNPLIGSGTVITILQKFV